MKTYQKIIVIFIGGGLSWALAYCSSIWPSYAMVLASLSLASTSLVGTLTGFIPTKTT